MINAATPGSSEHQPSVVSSDLTGHEQIAPE
jgi:hypothetical protein